HHAGRLGTNQGNVPRGRAWRIVQRKRNQPPCESAGDLSLLMRPEFERLRSIYAAADAAVASAGPRCDASGRCCRFKEFGHTLFVSQLEADYLLTHACHFDGPVNDATCPFQVENFCT